MLEVVDIDFCNNFLPVYLKLIRRWTKTQIFHVK